MTNRQPDQPISSVPDGEEHRNQVDSGNLIPDVARVSQPSFWAAAGVVTFADGWRALAILIGGTIAILAALCIAEASQHREQRPT